MSAEPSVDERETRMDRKHPAPGKEAPESAAASRVVIVCAEKGWRLPDLFEAWKYRELFWVLATRDIKVRYKQTVLGIGWAVVQPLFTMILFTMISRVGSIPTDGMPPQVFYYCGMLP